MLQIPVIHPTHHCAIFQALVKERCRSTNSPSFLGAYKVRESPVEPGQFDILGSNLSRGTQVTGQIHCWDI